MTDSEEIFVIGDMYMHGRKMFEDALLDRNVCKRKVLIEKHLPKYVGENQPKPDAQFIASMGATILFGEVIHRSLTTKFEFRKSLINMFKSSPKKAKDTKTQKDARTSLWEIAKFTIKFGIAGIKLKRATKKKS